MNVSDDALIGKNVGSFKVVATLGEGAYGTVYQGVHPTIGRMVAIKVLNAAWSSDRAIVNRFIDEARAANSINHPNIIQIYDFGQLDDGRFFCIMEYIQGKELNEIIEERQGLELKYVEIILPQIVSALSAAHEAKVIHRDLKPDNIMVFRDRDGIKIKILDFGIAKLLENKEPAKRKTQSGDIMGTPAYMAPEQARGKVELIDERTDIYSLGVITYQMLSGKLPIDGRSIPDLLIKVLNEAPTPLSEVAPELPEGIGVFLERVLSKNQEDRPATAEAFYSEFEHALYSDPQYAATAIEDSPQEITSVPVYLLEEHGYDQEIVGRQRDAKHVTSQTEEYEVLYSSQIREDRKKYIGLNKNRSDRFRSGQAQYTSYDSALQEAINGERYEESREDSQLMLSAINIREELGYGDPSEQALTPEPHHTDISGDSGLIAAALKAQDERESEPLPVKKRSGKVVENIMFGALLLALVLGALYYLMVYRKPAPVDEPAKKPAKGTPTHPAPVDSAMGASDVMTADSLPPTRPVPAMSAMVAVRDAMPPVSTMGQVASCSKVWCMTKQFSVPCCCSQNPFENLSSALVQTKLRALTPRVKACFVKHKYKGVAKVTGQLRCNGTVRTALAQTSNGNADLKACISAVVYSVSFPRFRALKQDYEYSYIIN